MELPVLQPEEHVLSTLEHDGSRRWIYPKLSKGVFWQYRRVVAYVLVAVYALLPFVEIGGKPAILLDLAAREFTFFGFTFLPTDTLLLAIFIVTLFLIIFFATAVAGRVWCGWACPQTVYMEFVFRPIERLFMGTAGRGLKPRQAVAPWRIAAMYAVYLVICLHLSNMFLAYFVGVDNLHRWIWTSTPFEHPAPFAIVAFITGLMMFDFCYWREQLCIIGCPYGRFQSVMLDRSSCIIGYDERRGEPRGRGRDREAKQLGNCVDCHLCVDVCPTGIDIRNGLQLECIGCAQCVDICDEVMDKTNQPRGLIRYSSQQALDGEPTKLVRPRTIIYLVAITALIGVFVTVLTNKVPFDVTLFRGGGGSYQTSESGAIENVLRVKLVNREKTDAVYRFNVEVPADATIVEGDTSAPVAPGATAMHVVRISAPREVFRGGKTELELRIVNESNQLAIERFFLLGPY
ncbi:cytochrome c oxidase accessory protein CcoG [Aeoliella sp. SH292]|uniref:cytochrome c oxidase accessory protein CcoG n=1 Tax=Aeoliella sp. SH292 TaxID=3454464 RepID=UPI003F95B10A